MSAPNADHSHVWRQPDGTPLCWADEHGNVFAPPVPTRIALRHLRDGQPITEVMQIVLGPTTATPSTVEASAPVSGEEDSALARCGTDAPPQPCTLPLLILAGIGAACTGAVVLYVILYLAGSLALGVTN